MNFIMDVIAEHSKPVILSSDYAYGADRDRNEAVLAFRKKGIIVYPSPGRAARILAKMCEYSRYLNLSREDSTPGGGGQTGAG
jgi:acyl-CoA synthetase (NDP forming)